MDRDAKDIGKDDEKQKGEDRGGVFGWFYRLYDRYDTWSGRWDWFNWLLGFFKTHTAATVATTTAAAVTVGGAVVLINPELRPSWFPLSGEAQTAAGEVEVRTERWGSSVVFPIEGKDMAGRRAAFDVAVLPKDLTWAHKSSTVLSQGGTMIADTEAVERIFTPELRQGLSRSVALIAVGLASQEGQRLEEAQRAARRAETASSWLAAIASSQIPIFTLNFGQYRATCEVSAAAADTGWQRPLILIGVRSRESDVNLAEALSDAMSGKSNLPSRDCYTNFDLTQVR